MKKFLVSLMLGAAVWACTPKNQFVIDGTVEGEASGNALLVVFSENKSSAKPDTLAKAPIVDGKFKLTGTTEVPLYGFVTLEGTRNSAALIVENVKLTAVINTTDNSLSAVTGSAEQDVLKAFNDNTKALRSKSVELNQAYGAATEAKDEEKIQEIRQQASDIQEASKAQEEELMKAHPDNIATAFILLTKVGGLETDKLAELYNLLGENAKNSTYGVQIKERLDKLEVVAVGKVAPDFTQNNPAGEPVSLHSIQAKVKIIDFWASWCGPCRQTNPSIVELYKKYHDKGLEIIGVSLDQSKENWEKAIQDDNLTWVQVSDLKYWQNEAAQLYCVSSIPHMLVLDENNVIVAKNLRGEELANKIAELLK
jgi:thiol-disulfide isomerase/thioredoxin